MEKLKKGEILKCVGRHPNSTADITIGNKYPVQKIYKSGTNVREFAIYDDSGKWRRYPKRTKMFVKADGSDLYNNEQMKIMELFVTQIKVAVESRLNKEVSQESSEAYIDEQKKESLIKIMKAWSNR